MLASTPGVTQNSGHTAADSMVKISSSKTPGQVCLICTYYFFIHFFIRKNSESTNRGLWPRSNRSVDRVLKCFFKINFIHLWIKIIQSIFNCKHLFILKVFIKVDLKASKKTRFRFSQKFGFQHSVDSILFAITGIRDF